MPPPPESAAPLARVFGLDPRSLAVLRIGLGAVLLLNLAGLLPDIPAFYTDGGVLPRDACRQLTPEERATFPAWWASPHMLSGGAGWQYALFFVMAGCAVAVAVGYRTRPALFLSWVLLVGLQARNPLVLHGADQLIRCLLFWSLFLPLGARWGLDARRRPPTTGPVCSLASAGLLVQLGTMYVSTAIAKDDPMWRSDFTALYYALKLDLFTTPVGYQALRYPELLRVSTAAALATEFVGPLLLLIPWRGWWVRTGVVFAFWGLHLGIAAAMSVGLFPAVCVVAWAAVLPAGFWDFLGRRFGRPAPADRRPTPAGLSVGGAVLVGCCLVYVLALTAARTRHGPAADLKPGPVRVLGEAAHLNQTWFMFAPRPHDFGGWVEVRGTLADGTRVNLLDPPRPPGTRPAVAAESVGSKRWRKAVMNLYESGDAPHLRAGLLDHYRRRWEDGHPAEPLVAIEIVGVMVPTPPPGQPADPRPVRQAVLAEWRDAACPGGTAASQLAGP